MSNYLGTDLSRAAEIVVNCSNLTSSQDLQQKVYQSYNSRCENPIQLPSQIATIWFNYLKDVPKTDSTTLIDILRPISRAFNTFIRKEFEEFSLPQKETTYRDYISSFSVQKKIKFNESIKNILGLYQPLGISLEKIEREILSATLISVSFSTLQRLNQSRKGVPSGNAVGSKRPNHSPSLLSTPISFQERNNASSNSQPIVFSSKQPVESVDETIMQLDCSLAPVQSSHQNIDFASPLEQNDSDVIMQPVSDLGQKRKSPEEIEDSSQLKRARVLSSEEFQGVNNRSAIRQFIEQDGFEYRKNARPVRRLAFNYDRTMGDLPRSNSSTQEIPETDLEIRYLEEEGRCGVFAKRDIRCKEAIGAYAGELTYQEDVSEENCFVLPLTDEMDDWAIDASKSRNHTAYIRPARTHEEANLRIRQVYQRSLKVLMIAKKDIPKGTELRFRKTIHRT